MFLCRKPPFSTSLRWQLRLSLFFWCAGLGLGLGLALGLLPFLCFLVHSNAALTPSRKARGKRLDRRKLRRVAGLRQDQQKKDNQKDKRAHIMLSFGLHITRQADKPRNKQRPRPGQMKFKTQLDEDRSRSRSIKTKDTIKRSRHNKTTQKTQQGQD